MRSAVAALLLGLCAAADVQKPKPDADTLKMVEFFLKTPVSQLPPDLPSSYVDRFMAVDPETLPAKLRKRVAAKKLEFHTLAHLATGNKKGLIRIPDDNCAIPVDSKSDDAKTLIMAGYQEIEELEKDIIQEKSKCTERDMMCEFSLQIVVERDPKTQKVKRRRFFLYDTDPLFAFIAEYRGRGRVGGNTPFFGQPKALCSR